MVLRIELNYELDKLVPLFDSNERKLLFIINEALLTLKRYEGCGYRLDMFEIRNLYELISGYTPINKGNFYHLLDACTSMLINYPETIGVTSISYGHCDIVTRGIKG